jgi:hypothetical protein
LTTAADGKQYNITFYALDMVLAIGFRVRSPRGTEFRKWANTHLKQYLIKGFVMDDERLKNPDGRADYFDELLARIRDIRTSELRFYQKVRDLLTLSSDYDPTDKATQMFFAETQNKLLSTVRRDPPHLCRNHYAARRCQRPQYEPPVMEGARCAQGRHYHRKELSECG